MEMTQTHIISRDKSKLALLVKQIRFEANGINSYELVHPQGEELPPFSAGAHIDIILPNGMTRQYSLCNSPAERHRYVIAVLRDAVRGSNPAAGPQEFAQWLRDNAAAPNSYCSGNVLEVPEGATVEEEVTRRRHVTRQIVAILTQSENLKGDERAAFVRRKFDELEQSTKQ